MTATEQIDQLITDTPDWRGEMLKKLRALIHQASLELTEEWKWNTPVFSKKGTVCALGIFKDHLKLNFFKGASLEDPDKLFNAGLDAKTSRSIDFKKGEEIGEEKLKKLIKRAAEYGK